HMFVHRSTESDPDSETSPEPRLRWFLGVPDTTLSVALALAVLTSVQPLLFSVLHAWVSPAGAAPLPAGGFSPPGLSARRALAALGAAGVAMVVVSVICSRLGSEGGGAPPARERKALAELLADLSRQTAEIREHAGKDPEIAGLLAQIGATTDRAASLLPRS